MDKIFLYWDNSNIFISAQDVAAEREGWGARSRVRIHFPAMVKLARRQRPIGRALAAGSVPISSAPGPRPENGLAPGLPSLLRWRQP